MDALLGRQTKLWVDVWDGRMCGRITKREDSHMGEVLGS